MKNCICEDHHPSIRQTPLLLPSDEEMLCRIADLTVSVPTADGLADRCAPYRCAEEQIPDIIIHADRYRAERYDPRIRQSTVAYMESAYQFYRQLLGFGGFYLHASAVAVDGKAYLFSGPSGMGKSTHTRLWQQVFGDRAIVFNDDKPALRYMDNQWYAYGTPWCGKDGINQNMQVPLAGICFLQQAGENRIRRLPVIQALTRFLTQTIYKELDAGEMGMLMASADRLLREIPVFELENRPEPAAVSLAYRTMSGSDLPV